MKKSILLLGAVLLSGVAVAQTNTDKVTLNINLNPIQTLMVNPSQKVVDLDYISKADYASGVSVEQENHLTIYSTGGFTVQVKSEGNELTGTKENISFEGVTIAATEAVDGIENVDYTTVQLSNADEELLSSDIGGVDKDFNVTYAAKGGNAYVDKYHNEEKPTVYTTTLTYTILPK